MPDVQFVKFRHQYYGREQIVREGSERCDEFDRHADWQRVDAEPAVVADAPPADAPVAADEASPVDVPDVRAVLVGELEARGVEVDQRWGVATLRRKLADLPPVG